ncbi:RNA polymerase sigma factor [Terriglobus roseus]|uniref:RNA polymerase sigma-70 factor, ECF subfamily n=1 Tax=Terriglobus roseus TaxID=392734 RepID=A0A1H4LR33_9BACT|nr:RNA polymerase sigma factor [Terriglobus roseus]SEB73066.1 RNA polymerase sigma-70 factor, ECF subfamily [Terriglobus roseus]
MHTPSLSFFSAAAPMGSDVSDRQRIARGLKLRDAGLLEELIAQYQHRLMRYLTAMTGRPELAEDIFQETWIRVLERGQQYDDRGSFDAWLFTIARNRALDYFRRRSLLSLDGLMQPEDGSAPFDVVAKSPSPLEQIGVLERAAALADAMAKLNPIHREVLVLHFYEDLTMREIAEVTGIRMPTVKSRLYRAIRFFEGFLRSTGPFFTDSDGWSIAGALPAA